MSNPGRTAHLVLLVSLVGGTACGGSGDQQPHVADQQAIVAAVATAVTEAERAHAARAAYYASEAARYRQVATQQREAGAAYGRRVAATPAAADRNAKRQVSAEARALAADQIAALLKPVIDFHTAEAAKEVAR